MGIFPLIICIWHSNIHNASIKTNNLAQMNVSKLSIWIINLFAKRPNPLSGETHLISYISLSLISYDPPLRIASKYGAIIGDNTWLIRTIFVPNLEALCIK
jgi:hypothetical protein